MRRVIVQEIVSLDGFASRPDGELDFFDKVGDYSGVDQRNLGILDNVDAILLGTATYRIFVEFWPTATDEVVAQAINSIPKKVFSSTLDEAPWGDWPAAEVLRGDAVERTAALKAQEGKDIIVWGSLSLARALMTAGVVDELDLQILPVVIGSGQRLFPTDRDRLSVELVEATPHSSGIISVRYRVSAEP